MIGLESSIAMSSDLESSKGPMINSLPAQKAKRSRQDNGGLGENPVRGEHEDALETVMCAEKEDEKQEGLGVEELKSARRLSPKPRQKSLRFPRFVEATAGDPSMSVKTLGQVVEVGSGEGMPAEPCRGRSSGGPSEEVKRTLESEDRNSVTPLPDFQEVPNNHSMENHPANNPLLSGRESLMESGSFAQDAENGLSYTRMALVTSYLHPHTIQDSGVERHRYCEDTGTHPCFLCYNRRQSAFKRYGTGVVLYFKQLKFLAVLALVVSIFAVPAFVLFVISSFSVTLGNNSYDNALNVTGINRKDFLKMTLGNLGMGGYACSNGKPGEDIYLACSYGTIYKLVSVGYSSETSTCKSDVSQYSTLGPGLKVDAEFAFGYRDVGHLCLVRRREVMSSASG